MSGVIGQINVSSGDGSIGATLFRMYQKGELSHKEYLAGSAKLVAEGSSQEQISLYTPMMDTVRKYMAGRLFGGNSELNAELSKKLGDWRHSIFQALDHNAYMIEHLTWALDICDSVKMGSHSEMLQRALKRFEGLRFPAMEYQQAIDVQKMDSSERERQKRGA